MKRVLPIAGFILALFASSSPMAAAELTRFRQEVELDAPGQEDALNRSLWEHAKKTPYEDAEAHVEKGRRSSGAGRWIATLPNGWRIAPAGTQTQVDRFPYEAVAFAGKIVVLNNGYYYSEKPQVSIVDPNSGQVVRILRLDSLFPSARVGLDNDLYISGGFSQKVVRVNSAFHVVREYSLPGYTGGITPLDATHVAVASLVAGETQEDLKAGKYGQGRISILNTVTGKLEQDVQTGYFPYALKFTRGKLYAVLLGENKLLVYNRQLKLIKALAVGRTPQDVTEANNRLYVVNSGEDSVSVIDTEEDTVTATFDMSSKGTRFGSAPSSCAVDKDRLFVTLTNSNAVAVLNARTGKRMGYIPTGWYPTKVLLAYNRLITLSAKGIRARRPNIDGPQAAAELGGPQYVLTLLKGSLGMVRDSEIAPNLRAWTRQVETSMPLRGSLSVSKHNIRHIFYIVRENRTYDQVLGDLGRGNGDPYLTLFGQDVTPNGHKMARDFVTLDNYYADGEISVLGHSFTTSGYASPFLEWLGNEAYSGRYKSYPFGTVPAATSPAYLWDSLDAQGIDYRIYGENYFLYTRGYRLLTEALGADSDIARKFYARMMELATQTDRGNLFYKFAKPYYGQANTLEDAGKLLLNPDFAHELSAYLCGDDSLATAWTQQPNLRRKFAEYLTRYPFNYRSWDLNFSDLERARVWKADFDRQEKQGKVAQLHYIWLPNDHTGGTSPLYLAPEQLVAQNDAALGFIVQTIAHSSVWKDSLILITEDDAQNGPDHVDATRTVALAIGPQVKRGAVISDRYDQLSLLRTIEWALDIPPMNRDDASAAPMSAIFAREPDFAPYLPAEPSAHLTDSDRTLYHSLATP